MREIRIHSFLENDLSIDIHNCDSDVEDRDAALNVLRNHFGAENVIAISNYNTLQLKSLVKDISKLYNVPYEEVNATTSVMEKEARQAILDELGGDQKLYVFDLDGATKHSPSFRSFLEKYPHVAESIKVLFKQNKNISRHAGGVLLTENAQDNMPIIRIRGEDQTPWGEGLTAKHLEPMGFVKYDFLGIATLRIIRRCIERILKNKGQDYSYESVRKFFEENLSPDVIGQGDEEIFKEVYHKGNFCGTFQFSMANAQKFCKDAKPMSINDISAITSIYRPGPLSAQADKKYVYYGENPEEIDYYHPIVKEILKDTRSLVCYQEQFMLLANKLAGFTLTESDELRKLLVKPVASLGEEMKKKRIDAGNRFIEGCVESGLSRDRAEKLWNEEILGFVSYGFARPHAISYSYLSYQSAYLWHFYPDEWVCSYLENDPDPEAAISEVKQAGYNLANLDIISSGVEYTVKDKIIYPPFSSVKGIGSAAIQELLELRKDWQGQTGISSFWDFFFNIETTTLKNGKIKTKRSWKFSKFNKRSLDALIRLEALNGLNIFPDPFLNHNHLRKVLIDHWDQKEKQLFDLEKLIEECDTSDFDDRERVDAQHELLGTYDKSLLLAPDVIDFLRDNDILPLSDLADYPQNIWFVLTDIQNKTTKNGKPYFKLSIMDITGKEETMNYFFQEPKKGWQLKGVYWAKIFRKDGFVNNARGTYIERIV